MLEGAENCREFRDTLNRYLDQDLELVGQATFVGHLAACARCRSTLLQYSDHIQAHRIMAAGGHLDRESVQALKRVVPSDFAAISDRIVRKRARELGRLKLQILQVYLKHVLSEHAWPRVLGEDELPAARAASRALMENLERFKESSIIFADGGMVDLRSLRDVLEQPLDGEREGIEPQLRHIARGLLSSRTLDPSLDEYVLQLLGVIFERLGYYREARHMFQTLAQVTPHLRPHLRAQALNSAAHTSFRYLGAFDDARRYLEEAARLYPDRWTIEYNLAALYLWPDNPHRDIERAGQWWRACRRHLPSWDKLQNLLAHDHVMRQLLEQEGLIPETGAPQ